MIAVLFPMVLNETGSFVRRGIKDIAVVIDLAMFQISFNSVCIIIW